MSKATRFTVVITRIPTKGILQTIEDTALMIPRFHCHLNDKPKTSMSELTAFQSRALIKYVELHDHLSAKQLVSCFKNDQRDEILVDVILPNDLHLVKKPKSPKKHQGIVHISKALNTFTSLIEREMTKKFFKEFYINYKNYLVISGNDELTRIFHYLHTTNDKLKGHDKIISKMVHLLNNMKKISQKASKFYKMDISKAISLNERSIRDYVLWHMKDERGKTNVPLDDDLIDLPMFF